MLHFMFLLLLGSCLHGFSAGGTFVRSKYLDMLFVQTYDVESYPRTTPRGGSLARVTKLPALCDPASGVPLLVSWSRWRFDPRLKNARAPNSCRASVNADAALDELVYLVRSSPRTIACPFCGMCPAWVDPPSVRFVRNTLGVALLVVVKSGFSCHGRWDCCRASLLFFAARAPLSPWPCCAVSMALAATNGRW